jgi:hypothetical protein
MFHAGLALELSRIIWDDRRVEARAGRRRSGRGRSERTSPGWRWERAPAGSQASAATNNAGEDTWLAWRVVEPDTAYLRRRAA